MATAATAVKNNGLNPVSASLGLSPSATNPGEDEEQRRKRMMQDAQKAGSGMVSDLLYGGGGFGG